MDAIDLYIENCKSLLRNPNSNFSQEARTAGKDFIEAWEAWRHESRKHNLWSELPIWLMLMLFPYYLFWTFMWDRRCSKLYKDLQEKQNIFNYLTVQYYRKSYDTVH